MATLAQSKPWSFDALGPSEDEDDDIEIIAVTTVSKPRTQAPRDTTTTNGSNNFRPRDDGSVGFEVQKKRPWSECFDDWNDQDHKKSRHHSANGKVPFRHSPKPPSVHTNGLLGDKTNSSALSKSTAATQTRPDEVLVTKSPTGGPTRGQSARPSSLALFNGNSGRPGPITEAKTTSTSGVGASRLSGLQLPNVGSHSTYSRPALTTPAPKSTAPGNGTVMMPFTLDDEDNDDGLPTGRKSTLNTKLHHYSSNRNLARPDEAQRQRQALESRRLRQASKEGKRISTPKDVEEMSHSSGALQKDNSSEIGPTTVPKPAIKPFQGLSVDVAKMKDSAIPHAQSTRQGEGESAPQKVDAVPHHATTPASSRLDRPWKTESSNFKPYASSHNSTSARPQQHTSNQGKHSVANTMQRTHQVSPGGISPRTLHSDGHGNIPNQEQLLGAKARATNEIESKGNRHSGATERKVTQDSDQSNVDVVVPTENGRNPKNVTVPVAKHQVQSREETERQLEESKKRDAAAKARKQAHLQEESLARQRESERRTMEEHLWPESNKARQAHQEALKKQVERAKKEASAVAVRDGALAKLLQDAKSTKVNRIVEEGSKCPQPLKSDTSPDKPLVGEEQRRMTSLRQIEHASTAGRGPTAGPKASSTTQDSHKPPQCPADSQYSVPSNRPSAPITADQTRNDRIQAKKERNARLQLAEDSEQQDKKPHSETLGTSETQPLPKGPVSLHSFAKRHELGHSSTRNQAELSDNHGSPACQGRNLAAKCREIFFVDVRLLRRRNLGWKYSDIAMTLERAFGYKRVISTLQVRYKLLKETFQFVGVSTELLERVDAGDELARQELNRVVHGVWPLPVAPVPLQNPREANLSSPSAPKSAPPRHPNSSQASPGTLTPNSGIGSNTLSAWSTASPTGDPFLGQGRPQTSGKTLTPAVFQYYLEGLAQENAKDSEEAGVDREQSPISKEDFCHFAYHVESRQATLVEIEDGVEVDDMPWAVCSKDYDNLKEANVAAAERIFRVPKGAELAVDVSEGSNINTRTLNDGLKFHELTGEAGGIRQVRVARFVRSHHEGVLPKSKEGWAPKTVYFVKKKTTTKTGDDMFDESKEIAVQENVDQTVYTTLELANTNAIKEFVNVTFEPSSGHLRQRQIEVQHVENQLLAELDEDTDEMFSRSAEAEDGKVVIDVWVEEGHLAGPRNL